jgi:hypothetical protein
MKKLSLLILAVAGLAACALWVRRHPRSQPAPGASPAATEFKATNDWQQSIRVDTRTDYSVDDATRRQAREELLRAERKQHLPEGKN